MAILPANVLIADSSWDWMRLAVPLVLEQDLAASRAVIPFAADNQSSVYQAASTASLRTTVQLRSGQLSVDAILTDTATQQNRTYLSARAPVPNLVAALDGLAKRIHPNAIPFPTRNERALEAFAIGFSSSSEPLKIQRLNDAVAADPSFGLAYIALAETVAATRPTDIPALLKNAESHRPSFTALDKVRFDLLRSRILHAPMPQQAEAAGALLKVLPNDAEATVTVASNLFVRGRAADAERLMTRALQIRPANANYRRQLAVGLIETKQFSRAEKILTDLASNPAVVPQLAACILLEGDVSRANTVYERFLASIGNPDPKPFLHASWLALQGHYAEAIREIENASFIDKRITAVARSQLVVWQLLAGRTPAAGNTSPIALLLSSRVKSGAEWRAKVDAVQFSSGGEQAKQSILAYGFFLYGFFPESAKTWEQIVQHSGDSDLPARAMLAASLNRAGKTDAAKRIAVQPFLPDFADYFSAVSFGQLRILLGHAG